MIYLATREPEIKITAHDIAEQLDMPTTYLSKIMQLLSKHTLVRSTRGPTGGFSLGRAAGNINLMQILMVTEGMNFTKECLLGLKECDQAYDANKVSRKMLRSRRFSDFDAPTQ